MTVLAVKREECKMKTTLWAGEDIHWDKYWAGASFVPNIYEVVVDLTGQMFKVGDGKTAACDVPDVKVEDFFTVYKKLYDEMMYLGI
jgi:hypothetical protein